MIKNFRNRALEEFFTKGRTHGIAPALHKRVQRRLNQLQAARRLYDMKVLGTGFHPLQGLPRRYAVDVNGPWRITFAWEGEDAIDVDLEQYH